MGTDAVDPRGPVFVSYRQSDGLERVADLAWLLRAAGIPVWHDQGDLPPGDTNERLTQALAGGLSGGVLFITPDIVMSAVVRNVELPRLLDLETNPTFVLAVANTVRHANGKLDYGAPDSLLTQPTGTLARLKQHGVDSAEGLTKIARELMLHRITQLAPTKSDTTQRVLHVSVQTRGVPHAHDHDQADLSVRLRPSKTGRLPSRDGLVDLKAALPLLPEAVGLRSPESVLVTGGAHLSVAFALGAALPTTLVGKVVVEDRFCAPWSTGPVSTPPGTSPRTRIAGHGAAPLRPVGTRKTVLAYVDLLPDRSDDAYTRHLEGNQAFDAWSHIRATDDDVLLDAATVGPLISETAARLRKLSQENGNAELHLLLRVPYPVAVLLGTLLNTLHVTLYEWDDAADGDSDARPRYVPALNVAATSADGPVRTVLLPAP